MYIAFFSTSDVFEAEEKLKSNDIICKVVPTPVTDKAYCGVCLEVSIDVDLHCIKEMEFNIVGGE
ncbi:MAG: DUF3343 domain-containing protein [Lachnospiraceae bacterium]|nr:DUF3343 domain-containing protein [Lachnospiraceae bacterium]